MNNPKYVKVDDELFEINTDFRVALECNKICNDVEIGDYERALAVIYKLFGEKGLDCKEQGKLLELGIKYLSFGNKVECNKKSEKFELDFEKCVGLIESSFKFDYGYSPYDLEYMHYYDFYNDLENLSTSEFGNCCALNRVISLLNQDAKEIKDKKHKTQIIEAQKLLKDKYCVNNKKITKEQEESAKAFYRALGVEI